MLGRDSGVVLSATERHAWRHIVEQLQLPTRVSRRARIVTLARRWSWAFGRAFAMARGIDIGPYGGVCGELGLVELDN
jgi:hypothetical protein